MNILDLAIIMVLIIVLLSFLMPWVSKKIEEPFVGDEACKSSTTTTPVYLPPAGMGQSWADTVELGKQKYNFLGFLQTMGGKRLFTEAGAPMGSIDNSVPITSGPTPGQSPLQKLNANIRKAFETVEIVPRDPELIKKPELKAEYAPTGAPANSRMLLKDPYTFQQEATTTGRITDARYGYVEERLPPDDDTLVNAAKCEVNNMYTIRKTGATGTDVTTFGEARGVAIKREDLCARLNTSTTGNNANTNREIVDAFPTESATKMCGVCIKDAKPFSDPSVYNKTRNSYNGIGALFLSQMDKNIADRAGKSYTPTAGSCAEGYFFVPGEQVKCLKAAQRLNCEEIAEQGGFLGLNATAKDGTDLDGSLCRACVQGTSINYAYYKPTPVDNKSPDSVRLRIVVPSGTGRTKIKFTLGSTSYGPFTIYATTATPVNSDGTTTSIRNNTFYYVLNTGASPDEELTISAIQEFPHRPRGEKEVFFLEWTDPDLRDSEKIYANAEQLADSIDCTVATVAQLTAAQQRGMQFCKLGWARTTDNARNGVKYIVRSNAVSSENPFTSTLPPSGSSRELCTVFPNRGGAVDIAQLGPTAAPPGSSNNETPAGVWCWGIKPMQNFLSEGTISGISILKPNVSNFYTNYALTNESGVSDAAKNSIYTIINGDETQRPNYRGICIQMERNTDDTNTYEPLSVGFEDYITKVGNTGISNVKNISQRLSHYSRNGRFNDSERIATPKPPAQGQNPNVFSLINGNQYWIWAPHEGTTQSATFEATVKIPGYFNIPTHIEDEPKCRSSVLYTSADNLNRAITTSCDNGMDDTDSSGCLDSLFKLVGGTNAGKLSPNSADPTMKSNNIRRLLYNDYNERDISKPLKMKRTQEEVRAYLLGIVDIVRGTSDRLRGLTTAERTIAMNEASQMLYGRNAIGPCERMVVDATGKYSIMPQTAPFDAQCLDVLYRNTADDTTQTMDALKKATYESIGARYSGLNKPGGEYTTATADEIAAFPYRTCTPAGSWAPLRADGTPNQTGIDEVNAAIPRETGVTSDIQKAIKVYNDMYQMANDRTADAAKQEEAIERCYGIRKKTFPTNCNGIAGSMLYIYNLANGKPVGRQDLSLVKVNGASVSEAQSEYKLIYRESALTTTPTGVITDIYFPITPRDILAQVVVQSASLIGSSIPGKSKSADYIAKGPLTNNSVLFYFGVTDATSNILRMISVEATVNGTTLNLRVDKAKFKNNTTTIEESALITTFNDASASTSTTVDSKNAVGIGIANIRIGLKANRYDAATGASRTACIGTNDRKIFGESLTSEGCTSTCCEVYQPYFTLPSANATVSSVELTRNVSTDAIEYMILVKDTDGVVAQKVLRLGAGVATATLNFLQEDVRPLMPYTSIQNQNTAGTTIFRLESALGRRYFLQKTGDVPQITDETVVTKFRLAPKQSTASFTDSTIPIYSIVENDDAAKILSRNVTTNAVLTAAKGVASIQTTDWAIRPAVNGAYAFVSLESANNPGYYLIADGGKAKAKIIDLNNDKDTFLASWRLYPAAS